VTEFFKLERIKVCLKQRDLLQQCVSAANWTRLIFRLSELKHKEEALQVREKSLMEREAALAVRESEFKDAVAKKEEMMRQAQEALTNRDILIKAREELFRRDSCGTLWI
jgi:hypothetical protein